MASFTCTTRIDAEIQTVFDLSRDIDAHTRSLADSNEKAIAGVTSGLIGMGESVTWRATHFKVPFKMTSKITAFSSPTCFVDEQTKGPFKRFRHVHTFTETMGITEMVDEIEFVSPLGLIGRLVDKIFLATYMERLIEIRNTALKEEAEKSN